MFDSKTIAQHRADEQAALEKAQKRHQFINTVLDALPNGTPDPVHVYDHGYCADASLTFRGKDLAQRLYELYPPMELADVRGGSQAQKPVKYLRPEEMRESIQPIFPIVFKQSGKEPSARWWTSLGDIVVEMSLLEAEAEDFGPMFTAPGGYESDATNYSSGSTSFYRKLPKKPEVKLLALVAWMAEWQEYADRDEFSPDQKRVIAALAKMVHVGSQTYKKKLGELGPYSFHIMFSPEEGERVLAFAETMADKLKQVDVQFSLQVSQIEDWVIDFFSKRGRILGSEYQVRRLIETKLRKDTGLDVSITQLRTSNDTAYVTVWISGWENRLELTSPLKLGAGPIRPQDIEVDYD